MEERGGLEANIEEDRVVGAEGIVIYDCGAENIGLETFTGQYVVDTVAFIGSTDLGIVAEEVCEFLRKRIEIAESID